MSAAAIQVMRVMNTAARLSGMEILDHQIGAIEDVSEMGPLGGIIPAQTVRFRMIVRKPGDVAQKFIEARFVIRNEQISAVTLDSSGTPDALLFEIENMKEAMPAIRNEVRTRLGEISAA